MRSRGQAVLVLIGAAAGIGLAYVDSLPSWDDSGILAGGMLLASGALTLAGGRPPWLMALATGLWIPARAIVAGGDPLIAAVMVFAFLGAYAGAFIRAGLAGRVNLN
jgi:hypothetical protein